MVAGRSFRCRSFQFSSPYRILMLLVCLSLCGCEESNTQQKDDADVNLHLSDVPSSTKQDDAPLPDPPSDTTFDSKQVTNNDECHKDGGCGPPDVETSTSDPIPAEDLDSKQHSNAENDIKTTTEQSDNIDKVQDQELKKSDENSNDETTIPTATNDTTEGNNSSVYQWIKFILDPIIEEFKDGIYPKLTEKVNTSTSESNVSVANESMTVNIESANETIVEVNNTTDTETNTTENGKKVKFECTGRNVTDNVNATVKLITTAKLLQLLNFDKNDTDNVTDCLLVMFYAPWCHFCAKIAPHYNALARAFPQLDFVAVDTAQFSNLLARFGTVSVPNILVFHQSRAAVKFNQTDRTFENFVTFVTNSTGLEANTTVNVTEIDYLGPVPSVPTNEPDYLLLISWIFVIFCSSYMFIKSTKGQQWINRVRVLWVLWQEHQHID